MKARLLLLLMLAIGITGFNQAAFARASTTNDGTDVRKQRKSFVLVERDGVPRTQEHVGPHYDVGTATTALIAALKAKNLRDVRVCVDAGAKWSQVFENGKLSIHYAAEWGSKDALDLLLSKVPELEMDHFVNARTAAGETPLMIAAQHGHLLALRELHASGALVNAVDVRSETALMKAARNGHAEVASALMLNKANLIVRNLAGETALSLAQKNGHMKVTDVLSRANVKTGS
jgi:ankyrin repeat protein